MRYTRPACRWWVPRRATTVRRTGACPGPRLTALPLPLHGRCRLDRLTCCQLHNQERTFVCMTTQRCPFEHRQRVLVFEIRPLQAGLVGVRLKRCWPHRPGLCEHMRASILLFVIREAAATLMHARTQDHGHRHGPCGALSRHGVSCCYAPLRGPGLAHKEHNFSA